MNADDDGPNLQENLFRLTLTKVLSTVPLLVYTMPATRCLKAINHSSCCYY